MRPSCTFMYIPNIRVDKIIAKFRKLAMNSTLNEVIIIKPKKGCIAGHSTGISPRDNHRENCQPCNIVNSEKQSRSNLGV